MFFLFLNLFFLFHIGLPYIRLIPKVTAVAGETLRLKCPVAGYPIEEIKWERANRELPDDLRQKVLPDGTLVITSVQKKGDAGVYTCSARNKQGHSARRSGDVAVIGKALRSIRYSTIVPDCFDSKWTTSSAEMVRHYSLYYKNEAKLDTFLKKSLLPFEWYLQKRKKKKEKKRKERRHFLGFYDEEKDVPGWRAIDLRLCLSSSQAVVVVIIPVPPKISPFTADRDLHLGERTTLTCSVTRGDLPLSISWLKDGRAMGPSERVSVTNMDQYNSILMIEHLSPDHNGNYSCVARNLAAEVSHTQRLVVHGNPPLGPLHFCLTTACPPEIWTSVDRMSAYTVAHTREWTAWRSQSAVFSLFRIPKIIIMSSD